MNCIDSEADAMHGCLIGVGVVGIVGLAAGVVKVTSMTSQMKIMT